MDNLRSVGRVKLLNFAYLSLDKSSLLGCGSFSKVYRGKYRGTPVAIKLLFTLDLNPELIRRYNESSNMYELVMCVDVLYRCSKEAQILSDIRHPNVVEIFGVSVLPPRYADISYVTLMSFAKYPLSVFVLCWKYATMDRSLRSLEGRLAEGWCVAHSLLYSPTRCF